MGTPEDPSLRQINTTPSSSLNMFLPAGLALAKSIFEFVSWEIIQLTLGIIPDLIACLVSHMIQHFDFLSHFEPYLVPCVQIIKSSWNLLWCGGGGRSGCSDPHAGNHNTDACCQSEDRKGSVRSITQWMRVQNCYFRQTHHMEWLPGRRTFCVYLKLCVPLNNVDCIPYMDPMSNTSTWTSY